MALRFILGKQKPCFSMWSLIRQNGWAMRNMTTDANTEPQDTALLNAEQEKSENEERRFVSLCINEVKLLGRVGAEPVLKYNTKKKPLVLIMVVTDTVFRNKLGENAKATVWHKVIVKDPLVQEFCLNQVVKGSKVFVCGSLQNQKILLEDNEEEGTLVTFVSSDKFLLLRKPKLMTF